jgi:hypothetical protein
MDGTPTFRATQIDAREWDALSVLPWGTPFEAWPGADPQFHIIDQRRGISRHPVIFVRAGNQKYAIKETSPEAAARDFAVIRDLGRRGCPALIPTGYLIIAGEPIPAGLVNGVAQFVPGDMGYCITRLATRVLPHSLLYQYPFTDENKRILLIAIARLMVTLHAAGIFWGDPSLANVLIDLSQRRLLALLADAETVHLYPSALSDALRRIDVDFFLESMRWQSEDIRIARGLPEDATVLDDSDAAFFATTYDRLRAEQRRPAVQDVEDALARLGGGMLGLGVWAVRTGVAGVEATRRPGWYREHLRDIMGVWIPRLYARRVYDLLLGHKWLLSEDRGYEVGLAEAGADWRAQYHDPVSQLLQTYTPDTPLDYDRYLAIMQHIWALSQAAGHPIPIEEGAIDYLLPKVSG